MEETRIRTSKRNFIIALTLLLFTNILMGMTLMTMSKKTLREQMEQRMLDVANAGAALLNGDELKTISPKEREHEFYQKAYQTLHAIQDNIELDYIYALAPLENGSFTFGIDPDDENPGVYGERIEATDALRNAANGKADVDKVPHTDEWGTFYTAYSPFFDSEGQLVGIVGVDFNADWFDEKLNSHKAATVILTMVALTIGIVLSFIIMSQNRKRFAAMLKKMAALDSEAQKLDHVIMESSIKQLEVLPESESGLLKTLASGEEQWVSKANEYDEMHTSIDAVYQKLQNYVKYMETRARIDDATGTKNKTAYKQRIRETDSRIAEGTANFSIAFFDINRIKTVYTHFGYEAGEKLMFSCAKILKNVFGEASVYHVTGDEFIVIVDGKSGYDMKNLFAQFDEALKEYNMEHMTENHLSVAKGFAVYEKGKHSDYRKVFIDAKVDCDRDKEEFHKKNGS